MEESLSVVIPAYNEAQRILPTLKEIQEYAKKYPGIITEVVVVDDGSRDQTVERVMAFSRKMPLLRIVLLEKNSGKWAAIRKGLSVAKNDGVLLLDADGSASVWNLERFNGELKQIIDGKVPVWGSRFMRGATVSGKTWFRQFVSKGYRWYASNRYWAAKKRGDVDDMQCPFKIVFKSRMSKPMTQERFCGDFELACVTNAAIKNIPITFVHKAGSKVRPTSAWQMFVETYRLGKQNEGHKTWE